MSAAKKATAAEVEAIEDARGRIMEVIDAEMKKLSKDERDGLRGTLVTTLDAERGE